MRRGLGKWSPLHMITLYGFSENNLMVARALLDAGADTDAVSPLGDKPLHLAATTGWIPVIKCLVESGVDIDCRTAGYRDEVNNLMNAGDYQHMIGVKDETPLMSAASEGHEEAARELLMSGASVSATDSMGRTALHYAARPFCQEKTTIVRTLLEAGADPSLKDAAGRTPSDFASERE